MYYCLKIIVVNIPKTYATPSFNVTLGYKYIGMKDSSCGSSFVGNIKILIHIIAIKIAK